MSARVSGRQQNQTSGDARTGERSPSARPNALNSDQKYGLGTTFTSIGAPYHFSQVSLTKLLECNE